MIEHEIRESSLIIRLPERSYAVSTVKNAAHKHITGVVNHTIDHEQWKGRVDPERYASALCARLMLTPKKTIVLLTAVSQSYLAHCSFEEHELVGDVFVTAGLANARALGDPGSDYKEVGTINIIVLLHNMLEAHTLNEIILHAGSVKTTVLQELGVKSPLSGKPAIGTGTDGVVVATLRQSGARHYAGLHTQLGELWMKTLAHALCETLYQAIRANPFNTRFIAAA